MKFKEVAQVFEAIEKISSRLSMTHELAALLKRATSDEARLLSYLSLGVLNPPYIGTQFAIAQKTMSKIIARVLGITEAHLEKELQVKGDLGSVIEGYEWHASDSLSVTQVYDALCTLEKISGSACTPSPSLRSRPS